MLDILKKKSRKSLTIRAIISIVIVIGLLALTKFAVFDVITGPTELDVTADPEQYEGKYVTIEVENFLTDYVEHTTTTTIPKPVPKAPRWMETAILFSMRLMIMKTILPSGITIVFI